jgi:hypothetical protein
MAQHRKCWQLEARQTAGPNLSRKYILKKTQMPTPEETAKG